MAFSVVVLLFIGGMVGISEADDWTIILALLLIVISGPGIITLGVMLVKHVRDIFRK